MQQVFIFLSTWAGPRNMLQAQHSLAWDILHIGSQEAELHHLQFNVLLTEGKRSPGTHTSVL